MSEISESWDSAADVNFIESELVPEMVQNRCFCEANSREFVELESVRAEPFTNYYLQVDYPVYRAEVVVRFSGEPQTFRVLVKLLSDEYQSSDDPRLRRAFAAFLNEEIMWNKAAPLYGKHLFPRFFAADMGSFPRFYAADMGRYGRPVIVVEDLERYGYKRAEGPTFTKEEAVLVIEYIVNFHGKGAYLKKNKKTAYRELYTKLQDILLPYPLKEVKSNLRDLVQASSYMNYLDESEDFDSFESELAESTATEHSVICNGLLVRENVWFKPDDESTELKVLDWQWVKYATGNLDVATLLYQCDDEVWSSIVNPYVACVRGEYPELCVFYAFVVTQLQNERFARLNDILMAMRRKLA